MIRILGIDPGSNITGYGIIDIEGNHATHITHGNILLGDDELPVKLRTVFEKITAVVKDFKPEEAAVEKVFMHRNADSALKLGQARGAVITACTLQDLKVFEYTPNQIKQSTVGKGHAAKQQVQHMVKVLLCLKNTPDTDAADALAIALCHAHSRAGLQRMGASSIRRGRLR
jgi:crossover junction endodeoxyribonuclease RuvC